MSKIIKTIDEREMQKQKQNKKTQKNKGNESGYSERVRDNFVEGLS